jgi:hypothetical protein
MNVKGKGIWPVNVPLAEIDGGFKSVDATATSFREKLGWKTGRKGEKPSENE